MFELQRKINVPKNRWFPRLLHGYNFGVVLTIEVLVNLLLKKYQVRSST